MPFSITFQKFGPIAPNLHNTGFYDVIGIIQCSESFNLENSHYNFATCRHILIGLLDNTHIFP